MRLSKQMCILMSLFIAFNFLFNSAICYCEDDQNKSAEQLFAWHPYGVYRAFRFVDREGLERAAAFQVFNKYFNVSDMFYGDKILPLSLRDRYTIEVGAAIAQARYKKGESWVDFAKKSKEEQKELIKKGKYPKPVENDDYLAVWWFDDLDSLVKEAVKNGEIDTTEEVILDRPVYAFKTPAMSNMRYVYATVTQEFLTASKPENLRAMIAAGMGLELNLLDNEMNSDLLDLIPHLGQYWTITNHYYSALKSIEIVRRSGAPKEHIEEMEETLKKDHRFIAVSWKVDDQVTQQFVTTFGDPDFIKADKDFPFGANRAFDLIPDYEKPYRSAWDAKRVDEITDHMLVITVVYDEKMMELYKEMIETKKKLSEEEQKAKQDNDKSGKH